MERRLAAIVIADVVGYSKLIGLDETGTRARFRALQEELVGPSVSSHGGRIIKTMGDAFLLEFPSAVEAVSCAVEVQRELEAREADRDENQRIRFRIGINVGDIIVEGDDIHGDGVNIAARLEERSEPGGVLISGNVHEQTVDKLDVAFDDMGEQEVKNIARPVRVWQWSPSGHGAEVPTTIDVPLPLPDKPSIAVLPFDNMSGDPEQEYFSDGISEDLTTALSRFDGLFVIARNSAFTYKGQAVDVQRVGRELGVRYVLEGSVRRAGDRVRVNAQLIEAEGNRHVWAERFGRQMDDVFELQDDIVAAIAATVGPEITVAEIERARGKRPDTLVAWDLYLRALAAFHKMTKDEIAQAISLLENAIKVEPDFASAYALLGLCQAQVGQHGWVQPVRQAFEEARRLAEKAVQLAPASPETNQALAYVLVVNSEAERAITAARRAVDLNPNYAEAYSVLGMALVFFGELQEGLTACRRSARSSPRDARGSHLYNGLGHGYLMLGEYEQSIEASRMGLHHDPANYGLMVTLAASYAYLGREAEAKHSIEELLRFIPRYNLRALSKNPMYVRPEHVKKLVEGMSLAGLPEE